MPTETAPEPPGGAALTDCGTAPAVPARSEDDTDLGWGEAAPESDDDRLLRDRPPHWCDS